MRAVLDTNVVVSAFLSPVGKPAVILQLVLRGDIDVSFNTAILTEYEQVLVRSKFAGKIHQRDIQRFFEIMYDIGNNIISIPSNIDMPDETDRKFYGTAKSCGAYLITGNTRHYPVESFIVTPAQFLALLKAEK
ncbi:MAG: putative toxin-antitoxin system toxin component, PIN family [Clostridiales bacterium]|jgi:putative PIN family toxin of toxin-antitoxin system|nr:putative toxin-antitoxin system toxin component, PIN family [Clostridiales bacterium]